MKKFKKDRFKPKSLKVGATTSIRELYKLFVIFLSFKFQKMLLTLQTPQIWFH